VIPCFEPVMTIDFGVGDSEARTKGRIASSPFSGPRTFVSNVFSSC
jgi:hypothetical protein